MPSVRLAFSPKWLSDDGRDFTLTFTGGGRGKDNDSFNTLRGRFVTANSDGSSSLFDGREHPGLKRGKGHIGLLGHTQGAEFRNIRIKELRSAQ